MKSTQSDRREETKELIKEVLSEAIENGELQSAHAGQPGQSYESDLEQMSESCFTVRDARKAQKEDISASETLRRRYGIEPEDYDSEVELQAAVRAARADRSRK